MISTEILLRFYIKYCLHISFIPSQATPLDKYAMQEGVGMKYLTLDYTDATNCYGDITVCSKLVKRGLRVCRYSFENDR